MPGNTVHVPSVDSAELGIKQATTRGFWGVSHRNLGQANFRETRNLLSQNRFFLGLGESWPRGSGSMPRYPGSIPSLSPSALTLL